MQRISNHDYGTRNNGNLGTSWIDGEEMRVFEQWWEEKRAMARSLEDKCNNMVNEVKEVLDREAMERAIDENVGSMFGEELLDAAV